MRSKLAYGAAGAVDTWTSSLPNQLMMPVYVVGLGLSPHFVSLATFLFRLWDAILDPLMGWISDNTRTRWGRRRPYLVAGALLAGLWFPMMWMAPATWGDQAKFAWLLGSGLILYLFFTIWAMPYQSLLLELTPDYHERTSVSSYRAFFQKCAGFVVGWAWFLTQLPFFRDPETGKPDTLRGAIALASLMGLLVILVGSLPGFVVKERFYKAASRQAKIRLRDSLRWTFTSRPFLILAGFTILFVGGTNVSIGLGFYVRLYHVAQGDQVLAAKLVGTEATLMMIVGFIAIPTCQALSRHFGKIRVLFGAVATVMLAMGTKWWTYNPTYPWVSVVNSAFLGLAATAIWQLIPPLNADIVDDDELRTRERREGAFASAYSWFVKAALSVGLALGGPLAVWCGFEVAKGEAQAASALLAMRVCYTLLPASLLGLSLFLLWRFPLTPARMMAIRAELESRRGKL